MNETAYLVGSPVKLAPKGERAARFEAIVMGLERAVFELELSAQALIGAVAFGAGREQLLEGSTRVGTALEVLDKLRQAKEDLYASETRTALAGLVDP